MIIVQLNAVTMIVYLKLLRSKNIAKATILVCLLIISSFIYIDSRTIGGGPEFSIVKSGFSNEMSSMYGSFFSSEQYSNKASISTIYFWMVLKPHDSYFDPTYLNPTHLNN